MPITIAGQEMPGSLPVDMDERLRKATGCSMGEHAAMLRRSGVSALTVAQTLAPALGKPYYEIVGDVQAAGPAIVAAQLAPLLEKQIVAAAEHEGQA